MEQRINDLIKTLDNFNIPDDQKQEFIKLIKNDNTIQEEEKVNPEMILNLKYHEETDPVKKAIIAAEKIKLGL